MQSHNFASSRRVLVVDDDRDAAQILVLLLEQDGHDVRTCSNGGDALALAVELRPDVVLLDLRLGDMTGFEVASALRADRPLCEAALVALTGLDGADVVERCRDAGFDAHVVKPIQDFVGFRELVRTLGGQRPR